MIQRERLDEISVATPFTRISLVQQQTVLSGSKLADNRINGSLPERQAASFKDLCCCRKASTLSFSLYRVDDEDIWAQTDSDITNLMLRLLIRTDRCIPFPPLARFVSPQFASSLEDKRGTLPPNISPLLVLTVQQRTVDCILTNFSLSLALSRKVDW